MEQIITNSRQILIEGYNNRELLSAYYKGESIENFDGTDIMGMGLAFFAVAFLITLAYFIFCIWLLVTTYNKIDTTLWWISLALILFGGPLGIVGVILLFVNKGKGKSRK